MPSNIHFDDIDKLLEESFEDLRLDANEKHEFYELISRLPPDKCRYLNNRAFDRVNEVARNGDTAASLSAIKWLEKIIKCLHAAAFSNSSIIEPGCYFSPGDECRNKILDLIAQAKKSIWVCVFTISDDRISNALAAAAKRDISIRIISDDDKSEDRGSDIKALRAAGLNVKLDNTPNHMHHKFSIFDENILLNGSFNWTRRASRYNNENIVVTGEPKLVRGFCQQFELLWGMY